mmetsp:Transcript_28700/g.39655  ORF Transcript_28700/g.39655 Transcript_28700/m.39655 type:complete len:330 (+) Transcript_28700:171-1160(+)
MYVKLFLVITGTLLLHIVCENELYSNQNAKHDYTPHVCSSTHRPIIWFQHIQRCGGYLACSYARENGVYDYATKIGCGSCPCGYGVADKKFQFQKPSIISGMLNASKAKSSELNILSSPKQLSFSKKDSPEVFLSIVNNSVNFVEVEYHTFESYQPDPRYFVYITVLRNPIHRTLSWISRFQKRAWAQVLSLKGRPRILAAKTLLKDPNLNKKNMISKSIRVGGFIKHARNAYVQTFSSRSRGPPSILNALEGLSEFKHVMIFEKLFAYKDVLARSLCWNKGEHLLSKFGNGTNMYAQYTHFDSLPMELKKLFEHVLAPDLAIYNHYNI